MRACVLLNTHTLHISTPHAAYTIRCPSARKQISRRHAQVNPECLRGAFVSARVYTHTHTHSTIKLFMLDARGVASDLHHGRRDHTCEQTHTHSLYAAAAATVAIKLVKCTRLQPASTREYLHENAPHNRYSGTRRSSKCIFAI